MKSADLVIEPKLSAQNFDRKVDPAKISTNSCSEASQVSGEVNTVNSGTELTRSILFPVDNQISIALEDSKDILCGIIDTGANISLIRPEFITDKMQIQNGNSVTLISAFNNKIKAG